MKYIKFVTFVFFLLTAFWAGRTVEVQHEITETLLQTYENDDGQLVYTFKGKEKPIVDPVSKEDADPTISEQFIYAADDAGQRSYYEWRSQFHWGWWSLLPAVTAIVLCFLFREPITALSGGIVAGAFLMGRYDVTEVLLGEIATKGSAKILILYLWLLGGLMGVWSRTGAAQAFAQLMTDKFVRGPRTAKLVAWGLGVLFFQGGTMSTVLVGTTVKPIADKEKISHEELAYVVDSTASPIASQLAFNAWPGYVQAFIYVGGVAFLATEADRLAFFFRSVPFCFYAIFAVLGTFLLSIERAPLLGSQMKKAMKRARDTGNLDAPDAKPLSAKELEASHLPMGYKPHVAEFFAPLIVLIGTAIGTFVLWGSPEIVWAFGLALLVAMFMALGRGMSLQDLILGVGDGLKGVVLGSVILLLAVTIGGVSKASGGGAFLVSLLGSAMPFWLLPLMLFFLTIVIAFSTGTSWGTYAVTFPLAMPVAWAMTSAAGLSPDGALLFMTICFAAVMDGSVFGDQCSPISDTTVLSSICTGCDLMDHVRTQIPQASVAAVIAAILWTLVAAFACS